MPRHVIRHRCFFDVEISGLTRGRIVFELFNDVCPKTCDNFRALCTGEIGISKISGKPLHYKGAPFHRIVKNFMIQGGDFTSGDGTGGESMYGKTFPDENFDLYHDRDMLLSMANRGKDTNGSQFFITTQPAPHLDSIHVVFGQVVTGQALVKTIENQKVDSNSRPYNDVTIINSGELVLQPKKGKKRKPSVSLSEDTSSSESDISSDSESDSSDSETDSVERMRKRRKEKKRKAKKKMEKQEKKKKKKKKMRKRNASSSDSERDGRPRPKYHSTVRPDEIPEVPRPRFLYRGSPQRRSEERSPPPRARARYGRGRSPERVPYNSRAFTSKSGRRIKGRGTIRYRTPTRSSSRERSATPPHWRREQEKLRHLDRRARFEDDERWVKGDKLRGSNQQGNVIISRKLRAQMADPYSRREFDDDDEIPRPGKPRTVDVPQMAEREKIERKLKKKEKKLKKKQKKEKRQAKKRQQQEQVMDSDNIGSSPDPEQQMYRGDTLRPRHPGPVSMSPMHTDPRSHQRGRDYDWDQEPEQDDFSRRRQVKSPSASDDSPPQETRRTNGSRNSPSRSRSVTPRREREEDAYGGKKGMKSFQIKTKKKEPKVLKDDSKRAMFQEQSSSEDSSRSRSRSGSPKRRSSRFEKEDGSPTDRLSRLAKLKKANTESSSPAMVSVLPRGDSESPPPTHWQPGQKKWQPKREIIRKEIERRLQKVGGKKDQDSELPRTRSPSPEEVQIRSPSSIRSDGASQQGQPGNLGSSQGSVTLQAVAAALSVSPGSARSGAAQPDRPKSPEDENRGQKIEEPPPNKWETPDEPDEGEIVNERDGGKQAVKPPAVREIPSEPKMILRKSDTGEAKPAPPKPGTSAPMVPRNIAMAQKTQTGKPAEAKSSGQQKSPGHVPRPPSTPPKTPAQASRPPMPDQPPLPLEQPPKPPGLPVPPKLPPRPPAEPPSNPPTRLHGLPPKTLSERINALPPRPIIRGLKPRTRSPSRSRSRSYSRSPTRRRRSYSRSSRSYSRSYSRSPRRRHSSSPGRKRYSYSHSSSRSRSRSYSPGHRRSRERYRRSHTTSTSRSRSPRGYKKYSRSRSRSYSHSSRSYSRSRSRSHSPRRRRYSSGSY